MNIELQSNNYISLFVIISICKYNYSYTYKVCDIDNLTYDMHVLTLQGGNRLFLLSEIDELATYFCLEFKSHSLI